MTSGSAEPCWPTACCRGFRPQRADVFFRFDGFGQLAIADAAQLTESGGTWSYQTTNRDLREYEYDALGRRIVERNLVQGNANETVSTYLFNDVNGRVLEEKRRLLSSSTVKVREQYVWSDAEIQYMVLRDRDADDSGTDTVVSLEERFWVEQGPDGSVWEIWLQNGVAGERDQFLYSPEGDVTVIHGESTIAATPHSRYDWDYLWRGMRAGSYPASDSFGTNTRYDGLLWNWQAQESHDAKRGTPLGEDIHAYYSSSAEHIKWNYQQTAYPNAGTSGAWSKARTYDIGGQMYDPRMDAYTPPAWESAAQTALAVGGIGLITGGLGWMAWGSVAWMAGGTTAGGLAGAGISAATGGDVWAGADRGMLVGSFAGPGVFRAGGAALARLGQFAVAHPQLTKGLAVGGAALVGSGFLTPGEAEGSTLAVAARFMGRALLAPVASKGLELAARSRMASLGYRTFRTQVMRGAAETGFEFGAFIGRGRAARLVIPEVKDVAGAVRGSSLTAFGLGRGGQRVLNRNVQDLITRIGRLNIDRATKAALIRQAQAKTFEIRLFGSAAKQTTFTLGVRSQLQHVTGVPRTTVELLRFP